MSEVDHTGGTGRWISFGVATYLVLGLGTAISVFLVGLFGSILSAGPGGGFPGTGGLLGDNALSGALLIGLLVITVLGAAVATGLGIFAGRNSDDGGSAAANGGFASAVGALVTTVVMAILLLVSGMGTGASLGGDLMGLLGMVVGVTVGFGITGAVAAGVGERSATW